MSAFSDEPKITLPAAARHWSKRLPHPVSPMSVWRACRKGRRSASGQIVRLEHARVGRRIVTSVEAIARFESALIASDLEHFDEQAETLERSRAPADRTPRARRHAVARAEQELAKAGF